MTYRQLIATLQAVNPDRLDDNVTVWDYWRDEFVPVGSLVENKQGGVLDTDVLDEGHFVLELKN